MDIRLLALIALALLMFIGMGKNPMVPGEDYVPPDSFKDGIKDKLAGGGSGGNPFESGSMGSGFGSNSNVGVGSNPFSGSGGFGAGNTLRGVDRPAAGTPNSNQPAYPYPSQSQSDILTPTQRQAIPEAMQPAPADTVPVPRAHPANPANPFDALPMPESKRAPNKAAPKEINNYAFNTKLSDHHLNTGEPIYFNGASVYTLTRAGRVVAMPDGQYHSTDGISFTVRNGLHQWTADSGMLRPRS